jgi:hypothetical protein
MSESQDGSASSLASKSSKRGAPRQEIWEHYTLTDRNAATNRYTAACNYCNYTIRDARIEAAKKHLLSCKKGLSEKIFVIHEQFDPQYQPVYVPQVPASTLGDLSGSVERVDASALVASMFPSS